METAGKALRSRLEIGLMRKPIRYLRKIIKLLLITAGVLAALVLLLFLAFFIRPVRNGLLHRSIDWANASLPGGIHTGDATWPSMGKIDIENLIWVEKGDTLLAVKHLKIEMKLLPLLKRDVRLSELEINGISADIHAIRELLPEKRTQEHSHAKRAGKSFFPRGGSIPGFPSVAIDRFSLSAEKLVYVKKKPDLSQQAPSIIAAADSTESLIDHSPTSVELSGSVNISRGYAPKLHLEQLKVVDAIFGFRIDQAQCDIDLEEGIIEGNGSGFFAPEWPFFLSLDSPGENRFSLVLSDIDGIAPPEAMGLRVEGTFERHGFALQELQYEALLKSPGTEDLTRIPSLSTRLGQLNALEGITASILGSLRLQPALAAGARIEFHSTPWLERGNVVVAYKNNVLDADTVSIVLPDLTINGTVSLAQDSITAFVRATAGGMRWLENLLPRFDAPETLHADASITITGIKESPNLSLRLETKGRKGTFELDQLSITAEMPGDANIPADLRLEAVTKGLAFSTNAKIDRSGDPTIRVAPLFIQDASEPVRRGLKASRTGRVRYRTASKELSFDSFQIAGALGDIHVNGKIDRSARGSYRIQCLWPEAPEILIRSLSASPDRIDSLRAQWRRAAPFRLDMTGRLTSESNAPKNLINGIFTLPGPAVLSAISPSPAHLADLGPVRGDFTLETHASQAGFLYDLNLDLNPTDWIDSSVVRLSGLETTHEIDTIGVAFEDLKFELTGGLKENVWNLRSSLYMNSARLLQRFNLQEKNLDFAVRARADFEGSIEAPSLDASLSAHALGSNLRIPEIIASAKWSEQGFLATLEIPQGLAVPVLRLARLSASYRTEKNHHKLLPGKFALSAKGRGIDFSQNVTIDQTAGRWALNGDSLNLILSGWDLSTSRPFRFSYDPSGEKIEIHDLFLTGRLGNIEAEGFLGRTDADLRLSAGVIFPTIPSSLKLPPALWPERLNLQLNAAKKNRIRADVDIQGVTLPDSRHPDVKIDISSGQDTLLACLSMTEKLDSIVVCRLELPASLSIFPPKALLKDSPLYFNAVLKDFPVSIGERSEYLSGARYIKCNASFHARGTPGKPFAAGNARITFPAWPKLSDYHMDFEAQLASDKNATGVLTNGKARSSNRLRALSGAKVSDGLTALLTIKREKRQLVELTAQLPLTLSASPPLLEVRKDQELQFHLASEELTLSEFDALLPPHMGMEGKCRIRLDAIGPQENPNLTGEFSLRDFQISLEDGSNVAAQGNLRLEGTATRPSLKGAIEIQKGILRIPDPPKNLHPAEGSAILWEQQVEDTLREQLPIGGQTTPPEGTTGFIKKENVEAEIDVSVRIPSGVWVQGQGLNVELAGELHLVQKGIYPTVAGELHAVRGNLIFIGRNFNMEKGSVGFFGEDKIDPSLDIAMSTKVEGVLIRIAFRGTLQKPELILTSEPEMTEGDIISFLLFGKSIDNLDHDQANLLQRRASEIATSFGLAQLEARLARQLGVDMVSIQKSKRDERQKSLIIGKYISRRALLKYEQVLEEQASFFVNLEYFLTRNFKIETILGKQHQSGIEADWTKEY